MPAAMLSPWTVDDLPDYIARQVTIDPTSGCWRSAANHDRDGYARIRGEGVHRIAYRLLVGPIPDDRPVLDHVVALGCIWRDCCWPLHLEAVTQRINTLRGTSFAAVNAAKEICDHGHRYTKANTYIRPDGHRDCRACIRRRVAEYKARLRLAHINPGATQTSSREAPALPRAA